MYAFLAEKAKQGDAEAFITLIEKHKSALYKVAKGYLKEEEDIADVMQDTILSAYEHIAELRKVSYFKTWITRILINHCNDLLKEKRRLRFMGSIPEQEAKPEESVREFYELLEELPEGDRIIFLLYYGEGFNTREIGDILELNENTVKSRLRRGRKKLEQAICC